MTVQFDCCSNAAEFIFLPITFCHELASREREFPSAIKAHIVM